MIFDAKSANAWLGSPFQKSAAGAPATNRRIRVTTQVILVRHPGRLQANASWMSSSGFDPVHAHCPGGAFSNTHRAYAASLARLFVVTPTAHVKSRMSLRCEQMSSFQSGYQVAETCLAHFWSLYPAHSDPREPRPPLSTDHNCPRDPDHGGA